MENEHKIIRDYTAELGVPIKAFEVDGVEKFFCTNENGELVQIYVKDDNVYDTPFDILEEMEWSYQLFEQGLVMCEDLAPIPRDRELFERFWNIADEYAKFDFLPIKELIYKRYINHLIVRK